jgi:hypothetical protein
MWVYAARVRPAGCGRVLERRAAVRGRNSSQLMTAQKTRK